MDELERSRRLRASILLTVAGYFLIQCGLFSLFAVPGGFLRIFWARFLGTSLAFHIFLCYLLFLFKDDIRNEKTGERYSSINLANRITLVRISTLPTLLYLVIAAREYRIRYPLLVLVVLIFATDFLDGYVSRRKGQVTKVGRMMDSASDYCLLIVLTLVFRYYKLIPIWFQVLVLARLGVQVVLMGTLIAIKKKIEPTTTFMGKLAVASIMVAYSVEVLGLITGGLPEPIETGAEVIVAIVLVVGIVDKFASFAKALRSPGTIRRKENGDDKERAGNSAGEDQGI